MDPASAYPPAVNPAYNQPVEMQPPPYSSVVASENPVSYPPPPHQQQQQQPGYPPQQPGYPLQQSAAGYYPPQQGYPQQAGYPPPTQQQHGTTTTVVVTQPAPVRMAPPVFKDYPVTVIDSNGQQVQTVLRYKVGCLAWLVCLFICFFTGGCWIIALIPCCIDSCKDVEHVTPTDGRVVGVYRRL